MAREKITPLGAVVLAITLFLMWDAGFFDQVQENAQDVKDITIETAPDILEASQTLCNLDEIVTSEIRTNAIYNEMLNNADGKSKEILTKWATTQSVETCEVVLLNELLANDGTEKIWRSQLGIKNAINNQACAIIECFDKYGVIEYLENQKENDG